MSIAFSPGGATDAVCNPSGTRAPFTQATVLSTTPSVNCQAGSCSTNKPQDTSD
ncbi:hypothetical protein PC116_g26831 [Phytophthora cactorum]|nr:hypothetical protein PC116_g26831 [Phytophthora cactorum]